VAGNGGVTNVNNINIVNDNSSNITNHIYGNVYGGVVHHAPFVCSTPAWKSSGWSFAFGFSSGNFGFGLSYSSGGWWGHNPWWTLPHYTWCGSFGWVPVSSPVWCGTVWSRPWHHPVAWGHPWCAPVAWPIACQPVFASGFGWTAYSTTFIYTSTRFVPPPPVIITQPTQIIVQQPVVISTSGAWARIASGSAVEAMHDFSQLQFAEQWNREHDLGYAVASAVAGLDASAAVALRRALDHGPQVIVSVPADEMLQHRLWLTVDRLRDGMNRLPDQQSRRDAMLVLGTMLALLGDDAQAYFAIDQAIDAGERSQGAFGLKDLLRARLDGTA